MADPDSGTGTESDSEDETTTDAGTDTAPDSDDADAGRTVIRAGRSYEETYRLDASEAGAFLIDLGEQLRAGTELTVVADEWELPFAFGEPVELEIEYDGVDDPELEIELELPGRTDETAPDVA